MSERTLPSWTKNFPRAPRIALLFAGGFQIDHEPDARILLQLGSGADEVKKLAEALIKIPQDDPAADPESKAADPWVVQLQGAIGRRFRRVGGKELLLRDHARAWRSLALDLTTEDCERLRDAVLAGVPLVGTEDEPSARMLDGLIESVALLGTSDDLQALSGKDRRQLNSIADDTVQRLLAQGPGCWTRLSSWLSTLAEAAPQPFLSALLRDLQARPAQSSGEGAETAAQLSQSVELLHALQLLGWDAALLPQVVHCLSHLLAHDPKPRRSVSPNPLDMLMELLGPSMPQTVASAEQRLSILREMATTSPFRDAAWLLLNALWSTGPVRLIMQAPRPRYRHLYIPDPPATQEESPYGQVEVYIELLMQLAGRRAERWAELVSALHVPDSLACRVLQKLTDLREQIDDPDGRIWSTLRSLRNWLARAGEPAASRQSFQTRCRLTDELYALLTPHDPSIRYAHLFAVRPELEDDTLDFRNLGERTAKQQDVALLELWNREDRWEQLARLANFKEVPGEPSKEVVPLWIAQAIARSPYAEPILERLLTAKTFDPYFAVGPCLLAWHFASRDTDFSKSTAFLHSLIAQGRLEEAWSLTVELSRYPSQQGSLWQALETLGDPLRARYWREHKGIWMAERPAALQDIAIERLLTHENLDEALQIALSDSSPASTEHRLRVLEALAMIAEHEVDPDPWKAKWPFHFSRHLVLELLRRLSKLQDVDEQRAVVAELKMFHAFSTETGFEPPFAVRRIAREPTWLAGQLSQPQKRQVRSIVESHWFSFPGSERLRTQQAAVLERWCLDLLGAVAPQLRMDAIELIGAVLARTTPDEADGFWPCRTARRFLDAIFTDRQEIDRLQSVMRLARLQQRGMTSRAIGEGGAQERDKEAQYRLAAQRLRAQRCQRTAELLESIAEDFKADAQTHDADAADDHWRFKMSTAPSEEPQSQNVSLFPLSLVKLENFRCFNSLDIPLDPHLNVFIGSNASGKTTVLDAISAGLAAVQDELTGSTRVADQIDLRTDVRSTVGSDGKRRPDGSLLLQYWGQSPESLTSDTSPSEKEGTRRSNEALRWEIQGATRGRPHRDRDDALGLYLRPAKAALAGRQDATPIPIFAYYGTKRAFASEVLINEPRPLEDLPKWRWHQERAAAYDTALRPVGGYEVLVSWWRSLQTRELEMREEEGNPSLRLPELDAVRAAVAVAVRVTDEGGMRCSNPRTKAGVPGLIVDFDRGDGSPVEQLELAQLSDGFRTHLALVMDLARRMVQANPPPGGDILRDGWGTRSRAVALIDEVDLHLHPSWQRQVLVGLRAAFPNTQFIVTTHSPQVLATVQKKHVKLLHKGQLETDVFVEGRDSNALLEDLFSVPSRPAFIRPHIESLFRALDERNIEDARTQLEQLEEKLGRSDEVVVRAQWRLERALAHQVARPRSG